jgi:ABC-2 type transport system ATP-binding protein
MKDFIISVNKVSKVFRGYTVLNQVSLSVAKGEIVGLVGNNGSGKSVLLKCICGLMRPTEGSVYVHGQKIGEDADFPAKVGAVIDAPGFLPHKSAYRNLEFLWSIRRQVSKQRINQVIELVGLNPNDRKRVGRFSTGMRQRLGLAQAILDDPETLILDEPFNGLDKEGVATMHQFVKSLSELGKTILMTTHDPRDLEALCQRVYEIDSGILTEIN